MRFVREDSKYFAGYDTEPEKRKFCPCIPIKKKKEEDELLPIAKPTKIKVLSTHQRKERLNYLMFRMRAIVNAIVFLRILRN